MRYLYCLALSIVFLVNSSLSDDRPDPCVVPNPGGTKIYVIRSWQNDGAIPKISTKEEPKQVARDRLILQPARGNPEDRKLHLWIETHIGSEEIKESITLGPCRFSPLKDFIEEEKVPKDVLANTNNTARKELSVYRLSAVPYNGIAISEGDGWRIEYKVQDGRIVSPITYYLNGNKFYEKLVTKDLKEKS